MTVPVRALIFDMDGTMIDSMGYHAQSWVEFTRRHGIQIDVADLLRRTTGRTGAECMVELFGRPVPQEEALLLIAEKESIYRELFAPVFREVPGFTEFAVQALRCQMASAGPLHCACNCSAQVRYCARPLRHRNCWPTTGVWPPMYGVARASTS